MTITRTRGDDWTVDGQLTRADEPVDLTGATVVAQIRRRPDTDLIAEWTVTVTDATDGELTLSLGREVTEGIDPGMYRYDIEVTDGDRTTFGVGSGLRVVADVTVEEGS